MLYFDVTKAASQRHHSGLTRTSRCLAAALATARGADLAEVRWHPRRGAFVSARGDGPVAPASGDWFLTPELFSEEERPGLTAWLARAPCGRAAIYHDSIPLRFPEFTWPRSVARHPHYLKMLGGFDLVLANSAASAAELAAYWRWLGLSRPEPVPVPFGADGHGRPRVTADPGRAGMTSVLMIGILEPRKNQAAVLDAAERLWGEGVAFSLVVAGRVNPHFGRPLARRIRDLRRSGRPVRHEERLDDAALAGLLAGTRFSVLPSLAEGCGLPVLESLWAGIPVLCSDLPALLETAGGGGCRVVPAGDADLLAAAMRVLLNDADAVARLAAEACGRALPTWADTAAAVLAAMGSVSKRPADAR